MNEGYRTYLALLDKVDGFLAKVRKRYEQEILCRKGCADCCRQPLSLWPVEAHHLARGLETLASSLIERLRERDEAVGCPLLVDEVCALYDYRPVLCRTHGYPFVSREEGNLSEPLVSFCPRNFQGWKEGNRLEGSYLLDLDALNEGLVRVNLLYLQGLGRPPEGNAWRVPVSKILRGWDSEGEDRARKKKRTTSQTGNAAPGASCEGCKPIIEQI
jgi:uncharacterized protein